MYQVKPTLLLAEDDSNFRNVISNRLVRKNYQVAIADNGDKAIQLCQSHKFDVAIVDLKLPDVNGVELLKHLKGVDDKLAIVIMTGYPSIDTAVEAMNVGAAYYLKKPFRLQDLESILDRILEKSKKLDYTIHTHEGAPDCLGEIIGRSKKIEQLRRTIEKVADSEAPVFIEGESGSGKELAARVLHQISKRVNGPFVTINCAALQEKLLESELFGHVKGAFTGATRDQKGLLEVANNGTLFIDEIGAMSQSSQAKLLRVLDSGEIRRVGDTQNISANVRLVSATNRDLKNEVQVGRFREDLFFRINVINIRVPPLRERKEDIPILINYFLNKNVAKTGEQKEINSAALELLWHYHWPGNVRELFNILKRAIILSSSKYITVDDFPSIASELGQTPLTRSQITPLRELEKSQILLALNVENGNKTKAAAALGISRRQLYRLMQKYHIF